MAEYTSNYNLYKPSRLDDGVQVDTTLTDNFVTIDTEIFSVQQVLDDLDNRVSVIVNSAGNSNTEIVDARGTFFNLRDRLTGVDSQLVGTVEKVALKADQDYVNTNLSNALAKSNFSLNALTKITSFNRDHYLDVSNNIYTAASAVNTTSWWMIDNFNEFEFTIAPESKWLVLGAGTDYSAYCVAVNLMGYTTRYVSKLMPGSSTHLDTTTITAAQGVIGDVIKAKHEGNIVKVYKKSGSTYTLWFQVNTTSFTDIVNRRIGMAHTYQSLAYNSCTNFMGLNNSPPVELLPSQKISKWKNKKWVTLGDSITWYDKQLYASWVGHETERAIGYQSIVDSKVTSFAEILNKAASGTAMTDNGNSNAGVKIGKTVNYTLYDLVTIVHGTNDFKLDQPIGTLGVIGDTTFNLTTFYGAYRSLVEYILTQKPTIKLVLITPLQRNNSGYDVNFVNPAGHKLIDYVNAIKAIGQLYGLPVLDLYATSEFNKFTLGTYTYDGLHPNNVGYKVMGDKIYNYIENVI